MIIYRKTKDLNLKPLWYWIEERHRIYTKKEAGEPWPWTKDPILQMYRFCNVFRELDKVTIWIRENWREPYANHPNLWFAMCLARQINCPETLFEIGFPRQWHPDIVRELLNERKESGRTVYTGAYIITAGGRTGSKIDYTVDHVMTPLWEARHGLAPLLGKCASLQEAWDALRTHHGFGPFMAYEVVTDLRWTRYLKNAKDTMTWANAGPGAKRGLNRLFGRELYHRLSPEQSCQEMRYLLGRSREELPVGFPKLEMRDIEHSLCEVDKYLRVKNGEGRPRSKYVRPT